IEELIGSLNGKPGSFVLQLVETHFGIIEQGQTNRVDQSQSQFSCHQIIPQPFGCGQLSGNLGLMRQVMEIVQGGKSLSEGQRVKEEKQPAKNQEKTLHPTSNDLKFDFRFEISDLRFQIWGFQIWDLRFGTMPSEISERQLLKTKT